jgi:hypothetical protein
MVNSPKFTLGDNPDRAHSSREQTRGSSGLNRRSRIMKLENKKSLYITDAHLASALNDVSACVWRTHVVVLTVFKSAEVNVYHASHKKTAEPSTKNQSRQARGGGCKLAECESRRDNDLGSAPNMETWRYSIVRNTISQMRKKANTCALTPLQYTAGDKAIILEAQWPMNISGTVERGTYLIKRGGVELILLVSLVQKCLDSESTRSQLASRP